MGSTPTLRLPQEQPGHVCLDLYLYRDRPSGVRLSLPIAAGRYRPFCPFRYRGRHTPGRGELRWQRPRRTPYECYCEN